MSKLIACIFLLFSGCSLFISGCYAERVNWLYENDVVIVYKGLKIVVEYPRGSIRSGYDRKGIQWHKEMAHDYGYISGYRSDDDEDLDVYVGPYLYSDAIFVVNQLDPHTGEFDEYKVMIGFRTIEEAEAGYRAHYPSYWIGFGSIRFIEYSKFKTWLEER